MPNEIFSQSTNKEDVRNKLSSLVGVRNGLIKQQEDLKHRLDENKYALFEMAEQVIDFSKIPVLYCNSTEQGDAPEGGDYFVVTREPIEDGVELAASYHNGVELLWKDGRTSKLPDSYRVFNKSFFEDKIELICYLFENPDLLEKFAK